MPHLASSHILIWSIAAASIALMLIRPRGLPEVFWTTAGALSLCALRLISFPLAGHAVAEGLDVYLFLTGMMLLAELAKKYGVFDWLANIAVRHAEGSPARLFTLIYIVGTAVTILMSNDATAVVLTPAVLTAVKRAKAPPLPYLFVCALIANAASFVLPISNPANLVVFHTAMPPLGRWLAMFAIPSAVSIIVTYILLRWYFRDDMQAAFSDAEESIALTTTGKIAFAGILSVTGVLLAASALNMDLGLPTCLAALVVTVIVLVRERAGPRFLLREISWSILPLVAGLFVIVEAVNSAGALGMLHDALLRTSHLPATASTLVTGGAVGFGTNLVNNLPLGLITGATLRAAPVQTAVQKAVLIGIDLGPNLSITGSLATILWLIAIRREGLHITAWQFLRAGFVIMPLSLMLALAAELLVHSR
ncbi:MAG TPA: arsenic transporter [Terriglobales bacterium]|nr:arsenic transporter [Terriglobales bacterium]